MKDEESDELLLSRAYWLSERTAVGQDTEATEQRDAKRSPASHSPILSQRLMLEVRVASPIPRPGKNQLTLPQQPAG